MEEMQKAFKLFDEDNMGRISVKNLKKIAREIGENISEEELQAMIEEFDLDKDGLSMYVISSSNFQVNESEFMMIMAQPQQT